MPAGQDSLHPPPSPPPSLVTMCFGSRTKSSEADAARSRELDKTIRADEKRLAREIKLLLLGNAFAPVPRGAGPQC